MLGWWFLLAWAPRKVVGWSVILFLAGAGAVLGLTEGVKPGPLLTMVIKETLTGGFWAGVRTAAAPIFTDGPLIVVSFLAAGVFAENSFLLAVISLVGAIFLTKMGVECLASEPPSFEMVKEKSSGSFRRGILTNLFNPNVYIFWVLIGGPFMAPYAEIEPMAPVAYALSFLLTIITVKSGVAWFFYRNRGNLSERGYKAVLGVCGVAMFIFACTFLWRAYSILFA